MRYEGSELISHLKVVQPDHPTSGYPSASLAILDAFLVNRSGHGRCKLTTGRQ